MCVDSLNQSLTESIPNVTERPRHGGNGVVVLPSWVTVARRNDDMIKAGDVIGDFGAKTYDPFVRTDSGLLLAEEFSRLDVTRPRKLRDWVLRYGTLDLNNFEGPAAEEWYVATGVEFHDARFEAERDEVRMHLRALVRLSASRPSLTSRASWQEAWAYPDWMVPESASWGDHSWDATARLAAFWFNQSVEVALRPSVTLGQVFDFPLSPLIQLRWTSILAPIYLQLYESLRRITEGQSGAALCRECHLPFLQLDGRRTVFCTARERNRHNARNYRLVRTRLAGG